MLTDVTKVNDPLQSCSVTRSSELSSSTKMYQHFDSNLQCYIGGPLRIKAHAHDKNASVNKFIREERTDAVIQTWPKNEEKKNK